MNSYEFIIWIHYLNSFVIILIHLNSLFGFIWIHYLDSFEFICINKKFYYKSFYIFKKKYLWCLKFLDSYMKSLMNSHLYFRYMNSQIEFIEFNLIIFCDGRKDGRTDGHLGFLSLLIFQIARLKIYSTYRAC